MNRPRLDWWSVLWTGRTTPPDKRKQTNMSQTCLQHTQIHVYVVSIPSSTCLFCLLNIIYRNPNSLITNHLFLIFEEELKQDITTILHSINRKAIKTTELCTSYNIFMNYFITVLYNVTPLALFWIMLMFCVFTNCNVWLFNKVCYKKKIKKTILAGETKYRYLSWYR